MLTTVIGLGVDFAIIFFTEIALPGLFAAIDLLLCVIDFLTPSGWNDQLRCVEERCFRGPNIVTDMLVFTHLPVVLHRFTAIMEATLNSRTGKRFFATPGPGTFSAKSRTVDPETGEPIERTETESAGMGNPMYEFNFADSFKELLPTTGAEQCGGCFNCKWPELRLIWLLTASIGGLFSEQNVDGYRGNVTAHCLANGSWYAQACGPMGAELLPYRRWLAKGYTAGFVEIDARIFDSYAATIVKRSREMGASSDDFFPELVQAARNWESVRSDADQVLRTDFGDDDDAKAAPFVYHVCRNHRHEASVRGLEYDMPHAYYDLAGGSIERITGQFLWDTCRRWKFEVFSDFGRWAHQAVYDIRACTEDKVECKKEARRCFGSCSGVDGSQFNHDFATTVALTELSEFVLGDGFDSAAAADCTVKTYVFKVPTFAGGDSFATWAGRLQTRSGMTAIGAQRAHIPHDGLDAHLSLASVRRQWLVRKERRQLRGHPARARAQPTARLCQWRLSPRLLERRAQPAAAAAATASLVQLCSAPAVAAAATRTAATLLCGKNCNSNSNHTHTHARTCPRPATLSNSMRRTGRRGLHPTPSPRRLWPRPRRRRHRGRPHGGARELPLCAPRRRGAPARLGLLLARGQPRPAV